MPNATYARSQGRNHFGRRRYGKYVTKNYLKAVVGVPESKWLNTFRIPPAPVTNIFQSVSLSQIPQGTTQSTRIANEITNKSIHIRLDIARQTVDSLVRIILFWHLDGLIVGAANPDTNLLENPNSYQSPLNKDYGKSFWVKFDKTYSIAAGQTQLVVDEIWRKLKCKTEYTDDAVTTISANDLRLGWISNQSTAANQPNLSFTARLTYLDV